MELEEPSIRVVYYNGVSVGVPFVWESKPGTPKHALASSASFSEASYLARPLTPPPSSLYHRAHHKPAAKRTKSFAFRRLFPKMSATQKRVPDRVGSESESEAESEAPTARSSSAAEDSSAYSLLRMFRRSQVLRSID